jgi:type IX secretion system substrate protein
LKSLDLAGVVKNNTAILRWKAGNIINADYFKVESSTDGQYFTLIGAVVVKAGVTEYSYQSPVKLAAGTNYFRIRQVHNDGSVIYSGIINIKTGNQNNILSVARNPATAVVSINNPGGTTIEQLTISDATGRRLIVKQVRSSNTVLNVDISKLQPGQYFVSLFHEGIYSVIPFLKQQ